MGEVNVFALTIYNGTAEYSVEQSLGRVVFELHDDIDDTFKQWADARMNVIIHIYPAPKVQPEMLDELEPSGD